MSIKLAHINVCGWTADNHNLREGIIRAIDADIISICETHLSRQNTINSDNYVWFGFNRADIHTSAPRASGGVGVLVKKWVTEQYSTCVVDKSHEGIIALKFTHNVTDRNFVVFSCYLPPENSTRGRDAQSFFAHLLAKIYTHSDCDSMFIGGDFNARIGTLSDKLHDCDTIPDRTVLDRIINQHGREFLEFLTDSKMCVLNGRCEVNDDNFTSISRRGKAVVDYLCVPHDVFHTCKYFKVFTVQSIAIDHGCRITLSY